MSVLRTLLLLFFLCSAANAQTALQLGTPIERELGAGQAHEFTVNLEENYLIQLVVEQRGIDVIVKIFSPSGKSLGEYDSPNGGEGPEHVSFVSAAPGTYRITVGPLDSGDVTGRFQIKIVELRQATEQELKTSKNLAGVKARGLELITEIEAIIPEIKSPYTRIKSQLQAAQLLWDTDEKRASKWLADAMTGLREFLASVDRSEYYHQQYSAIFQLRYEILQVLAPRDPDAALNFLHSTSHLVDPGGNRREHMMQETAMELMIADQIIRTDPSRALQIARQNLKKEYSSNLMNTLSQLRRQNPETAAELANEIAAKILNEKFLKNPNAAMLAMGLIRSFRTFDRRVQRPGGPAPLPALLPEATYRELIQKILNEALSYSQPATQSHNPERDAAWNMLSGLQSMGPLLDTIVPGSVAAVEKKVAEFNNVGYLRTPQASENVIGNKSADEALEAIGKVSQEQREQLYMQLASHEANKGDLARAKQIINDHVTNPYQRRQALMNIEQQEIYRAMNTGKVEEALRNLSRLRNARERAGLLAQIANQIGPGQKRATALNLLEQARGMLSPTPQAQDQDQMNALFEIARAFSRYDSKRAFEIMDPLIDQFNELCAAARTLDGFGNKYYDDDELDMQNGGSVAHIAGQMSTVLGSLALTNFDRAKSASDRINAPEIRLKAYLDIAQQAIQGTK